MKTCEIGKVKPPSQTDVSHIIECHEEVVSLKEHSETNQTETVNFLSPRSKAISRASVHLPPVTPTKPGGDHLDPLTPTTNLKMLISAASPEIRNLEKRQQCEKKERLFHAMLAVTSDDLLTHQVEMKTTKSRPTASTVASEGNEQENVKENSRKAKSLGLLCERFLEMYQDSGGSNQEPCEMSLDVIAKDLSVERRRIYDIINVLESVEMVSRKAKNRYIWHGQCNLTETLKKLKFLGAKYNYGDQLVKLKGLEKTRVVGQKGTCSNVPVASETLPKQFNSEEEGKKEKSLGVMSQKFIMLFLQPLQNKIISLETAARVLYGELSEDITDNPKFKTKVRRLYDIANILGSLKLIRKVYVQEVRGRKPAFEWIGPDPDIRGFEPTNLHCLLNSQEKKSSGFSEGEGGRRKNKRRNQKSGWVRHHSCNVLNQRATMEPKAPLSLPNSPEKQPPTPITDSSEFQLELAALYSRYPGQMHQFLTTPPAGSISSPSTARKLLLPSPSPSQPCGQEVSTPRLLCPFVDATQRRLCGRSSDTTNLGWHGRWDERVKDHLCTTVRPGSDAEHTVTSAGSDESTMWNHNHCGEPPIQFGTTLYPSSCVASPIMAITHGQKRSLDVDITADNEYQAVMKQLKVSHQPGSLISTQSTPSGESSLGYTPPSSGSPLQNDLQTSTIQASNAGSLPCVEKSNGWYDPISETPPSHMTKKRNKRSRKQIHRTRERKIRSKGTSLKVDRC
ncbi:putative transcription factor E2F7 [Apostichopus japonicus]|uniref:Putative transcription factor E2F7 n=1 Tax=Stichopus japonicus TaxID=307972 RepID=A0A2G8L966_STIJA|nr:putative transcription factor E2F7 [Apostichopus japonicus]